MKTVRIAWRHTSVHASTGPPPFIVDTDMDFDDTAALAYFAHADKLGLIDLQAFAVSISGVAFAGNGLSHARCLLDKVGLSDVPVADGDRTHTNNFPTLHASCYTRSSRRAYAPTPPPPCPVLPSNGTAAALLTSAIHSVPDGVTLITLGPLTNVAEALEHDPTLATRIGRTFLMGGCLGCLPPTSDFDRDYNPWVDAPAAQAVLRALPARIFLTSGEATRYVPLTERFRLRLAVDRTTPAADTVFTMASQWLGGSRGRDGPVVGPGVVDAVALGRSHAARAAPRADCGRALPSARAARGVDLRRTRSRPGLR